MRAQTLAQILRYPKLLCTALARVDRINREPFGTMVEWIDSSAGLLVLEKNALQQGRKLQGRMYPPLSKAHLMDTQSRSQMLWRSSADMSTYDDRKALI